MAKKSILELDFSMEVQQKVATRTILAHVRANACTYLPNAFETAMFYEF